MEVAGRLGREVVDCVVGDEIGRRGCHRVASEVVVVGRTVRLRVVVYRVEEVGHTECVLNHLAGKKLVELFQSNLLVGYCVESSQSYYPVVVAM